MSFTDQLISTANIWRNLNADGAMKDEYADTPTDWQIVSNEPCRVMSPPSPGRNDRGFGQALVGVTRVSFEPDVDIISRDIIEIAAGPNVGLWGLNPQVKVAQGYNTVHHLVVEIDPVHVRPVEVS
jgi:hypothetical protein